ncbi:MAG: hypothetical protein V1752_05470 [Candidatus Firestonebacteria bacterium]
MRKLRNLPVILFSVLFLISCSQVVDRPDAKKAAFNGVKEYCEANLTKEGKSFKVGEIESCVIQGNEAFIKINVAVITNGKEKKKIASIGCERDKDKNWKTTSVTME